MRWLARQIFRARMRLARLMTRFWHPHPPVVLLVKASRDMCLQTVVLAAKPSIKRLHLRELFQGGQRYFVNPTREGFHLTLNHKSIWSRGKHRSRFAAVMLGALMPMGDEMTAVRLDTRLSVFALLRGLIFPIFMALLMPPIKWIPIAAPVLIGIVFMLAMLACWFDAALQGAEMVFFIERVLEDLPPAEMQELMAHNPDVVYSATRRSFPAEWQRFVDEKTSNS